MIRSNSVDLPAPLGPMMPTISPWFTSKVMSELADNQDYKSIQIRRAVAKTGGVLTSRGGAFQKPPKREDEL